MNVRCRIGGAVLAGVIATVLIGALPPQSAAEPRRAAPAAAVATTIRPMPNERPTTDFPTVVVRRPRTADAAVRMHRLVIAHAGGDFEAPHSTLFAYKEALRKGAQVLEMDVQLSKDNVVVVHHDDTVDRTTDATGPVRARTAAQLGALDNAYRFVPGCWSCPGSAQHPYRGIRTGAVKPPKGYSADDFAIVTLATMLDTFPDVVFDIEIKGGRSTGAALARLLAEKHAQSRVVVVSFDDGVVRDFARLAPSVLTSPGSFGIATIVGDPKLLGSQRILQVPPRILGRDILTPELLSAANERGVAIWAWADDQREESAAWYAALLGKGVGGVIASRPGVMAGVVKPTRPTRPTRPRTSTRPTTTTA